MHRCRPSFLFPRGRCAAGRYSRMSARTHTPIWTCSWSSSLQRRRRHHRHCQHCRLRLRRRPAHPGRRPRHRRRPRRLRRRRLLRSRRRRRSRLHASAWPTRARSAASAAAQWSMATPPASRDSWCPPLPSTFTRSRWTQTPRWSSTRVALSSMRTCTCGTAAPTRTTRGRWWRTTTTAPYLAAPSRR